MVGFNAGIQTGIPLTSKLSNGDQLTETTAKAYLNCLNLPCYSNTTTAPAASSCSPSPSLAI